MKESGNTTSDHMLNVFPLVSSLFPVMSLFLVLGDIKRKKGKKQGEKPSLPLKRMLHHLKFGITVITVVG